MSERATRLARDLQVEKLSGGARALAEEAVLIVGRLEQLAKQMDGDPDTWLGIRSMIPTEADVFINAPLAEARQQATALKGVLAELAKMTGSEPVAPPASKADELREKREARMRAAGG